ncbi:hypothetical protein U9M48_011548 [Paspalum notatum var. saurae]|uniref:Uncharacterized protein n=1 Tax=Paspalum notatum var. saurae TaxID=547442 RepID=A0AAQ3SXQ8_PASNO
MSRGGASGGTKMLQHVSWLWRGPRRALCAARDLYVRSLTGCAGHLPGDAAFGYPTFAAPPSFLADGSSASSRRSSFDTDDDLRELIRAASQRRVDEAAQAAAAARHPAAVPRSQSVAMARIDEDSPCSDFEPGPAVFPRSRSYAVGGAGAGRLAAGRKGGRVAALAA